MCCVFGISYPSVGGLPERPAPTDLARQMLAAATACGPDAFGLAWCTGSNEIRHHKWIGRADDPALRAEVDLPADVRWFIGHVRDSNPLVGGRGSAANPANNHPVCRGRIVGVHAGWLTNYEQIIAVEGRVDESSELDSEALFAAVDRHGVERGLSMARGPLATAFAVRGDAHVLHLARSWGVRLVFAQDRGSLVFASEPGVLTAIGVDETRHEKMRETYQLLEVADGRVVSCGRYRRTTTLVNRDVLSRLVAEARRQWARAGHRLQRADRGVRADSA